METSQGNRSLTPHGVESPKTTVTTDNLVDFCQERALRKPVKIIQKVTGLSKKQVENIRQGLSGVSGTTLTNWIMGDVDFAVEYAEWVGIIRPGEADKAKALAMFVNAFQQKRGDA